MSFNFSASVIPEQMRGCWILLNLLAISSFGSLPNKPEQPMSMTSGEPALTHSDFTSIEDELKAEQSIISLDLSTVPRGKELETALKGIMRLLHFPLVDMISTFPLNRDSDGSMFLKQFTGFVDLAIKIAVSLDKDWRKSVGQAIAEMEVMHLWRRAVGFLSANMVNHLPDDREVRSQGIAYIKQFVRFVHAFNLKGSGVHFLASKQLAQFESVLEALVVEGEVYEAISCQCGDASSREPADSSSSAAESTGSGTRLRRSTEDPHPHRPKACAVCSQARHNHWHLNIQQMTEVIKSKISAPAPSRTRKDKKLNCASFFEHVADLVDSWTMDMLSGKPNPHSFCTEHGEALLRYLSTCKDSTNEKHRFRSTLVAVKFGRICGQDLSFIARVSVLPSLLIKTITPIEKEPLPDVEENDDGTDVDDEAFEYVDDQIHVDMGSVIDSSITQLGPLMRFAFEVPLVVAIDSSEAAGSGPRKEWASAFLDAVFNPAAGLFEFSDDRRIYVKPFPLTPDIRDDRLFQYRQIGRAMGISIEDRQTPWAAFTPSAVALLLEVDDSADAAMKYLEVENPALFTSLENLLKDYVEKDWIDGIAPPPVEDMGLTFVGLPGSHDPSEPVTEGNMAEYVGLMASATVFESIRLQMHATATGLYEVVTYGSLSFLSVEELSGLLRGDHVIDVADLKRSTTYAGEGGEDVQEVQWLWDIIEAFSESEKQDLLRFVSGSPLSPIYGFTGLKKNKKWLSISLENGLLVDQVPLAQICFTQLRIPRYSSIEVMKTRILTAIENAKTLEVF